MENYNNNIIYDEDDVEVKFEEKQEIVEESKYETTTYRNKNIPTSNFFQTAFSKKYLVITLSSLSILLTLFFKFLLVCGVYNHAFLGVWFFLCAGLTGTALILNILYYVKTKKVEFNVSTILTLISLIGLLII